MKGGREGGSTEGQACGGGGNSHRSEKPLAGCAGL